MTANYPCDRCSLIGLAWQILAYASLRICQAKLIHERNARPSMKNEEPKTMDDMPVKEIDSVYDDGIHCIIKEVKITNI